MNSGSPSAFAKAREEIQLWPAAAMAFYFTVHDTITSLVLFFVLLFTGAITYKMHEAIREMIPQKRSIAETRERKSRSTNASSESKFSITDGVWSDTWSSLKPDSGLMSSVVAIGMAINLTAGFLLFIWLMGRLLSSAEPSVSGIGLIALPLLMVATIVSSLVWSS